MRSLPLNKQKHGYVMTQILLSIFNDKELSNLLAFKGGTSLLFFHELPRFSTDLDFNLLDEGKADIVYGKLRAIATKYGTIIDEAQKFYGPILVLDYEKFERKLKIEVNCRYYDNHYEHLSFAGTNIRVMTMPDMFAHKLCALGERLTPRDVFDVWHFLQNSTPVNENIIKLRTGGTAKEYALRCTEQVRNISSKELLQGLGEVLDSKQKSFVKNKMVDETATMLQAFSVFPLIAEQTATKRMQLLESHPDVITKLNNSNVDISTLSESKIEKLIYGEALDLRTKSSELINFKL